MKKYVTTQWLSLLLALTLLLGCLVIFTACGEGEETLETQGNGEAQTEGEAETLSAYDSVEKELYDRDFTMLIRGDKEEEFYVEKYTGELLEDSIYERNGVVEEDFGINIVCEIEEDYSVINQRIQTYVSSGLDEYDVYMGHKSSFNSCAQGDYLYDMNTITSMDLTQPYWDQACRENLVINGKNYMMTGDIDPHSMLISACLVFNKSLNHELQKTEPYEMVDNGTWTMDNFLAQIKDVTLDLNGDGSLEYTADQYSLTTWMMDVPFSFFYGAGGQFLSISEDGLPELTYDAEQVVNIYEKIYAAIITEEAYYVMDVNQYGTNYDVFTEGRALYCDITLHKISQFLSEMEDDYGIVPIPKYDENQQEYLSFVNGASPFMMIAQTEKDPEFVGTILEAMAAYNYDKVTPNMFEIITKLQAARDPDSSRMVDYIIRNRVYDFGYYLDMSITNIIKTNLDSATPEIASALAKEGRSANTTLKKLLREWGV